MVLWFFFSSIVGFLYAVLRWGNLNTNRDFARFFSWGALKILGFKVEVEGKEHLESHQPCIYVANHQSGLDMATFGGIYPRRTIVIGKKEVKWIPFFGLFYLAAGNILIDRKRTAKAVAGLSQAVDSIRRKRVSIWIFPEGTRNRLGDGGMLPFKRGAFHMASQAGVPIVPLVSAPLKPWISWKERRIKKAVIRVKVLPPIKIGEVQEGDIERITDDTRILMLEALRGLTPS